MGEEEEEKEEDEVEEEERVRTVSMKDYTSMARNLIIEFQVWRANREPQG